MTLPLIAIISALFIFGISCCPVSPPPWNCPSLPPAPPANNVRQLRPGNIKAVMSMGDSITAGFAMIGYPPVDLIEDRNYVFSIGGAEGAITIPNLLVLSGATNLTGMATSWTWPLVKGAYLDAGVSMAKVENCPDQVTYLVNTLKTTYAGQVDFYNDWKLLTLFIGANNICGACQDKPNSKPAFFGAHLDQVLSQIHSSIPRVFVNLVTIFNISGVYYAGKTSEYCDIIHDIWSHECYCVETGKPSDLAIMDEYAMQYNVLSENLAKKYNSLNDPNFTVVVQPGLSGIYLPHFPEPLEYLSNLDCFHPSLCANEAFTYQIWNNMLTPVGKKSTVPDLKHIQIKCPTPNTYIQ